MFENLYNTSREAFKLTAGLTGASYLAGLACLMVLNNHEAGRFIFEHFAKSFGIAAISAGVISGASKALAR